MESLLLPEFAVEVAKIGAQSLDRHQGDELTPRELARQARILDGVAYHTGAAWEELEWVLRHGGGFEAQALTNICRAFVQALDSVLRLAESRRQAVAGHPAAADWAEGLEVLGSATSRLARVRQDLSRILNVVARPFPQVDWEQVRHAEEAYERGEGEEVEGVLRRLRAGEDA